MTRTANKVKRKSGGRRRETGRVAGKRGSPAKKAAGRTAVVAEGQRRRLAELAELGNAISPQDAARLLAAQGADEKQVLAFLAGPDGQRLWSTARAAGRQKLLIAIREQAETGNPIAQKLLAEQLASDDSRRITEQRLTGLEVRELLGRSQPRLSERVRTGDWIAAGHDKRYGVAEIISLIPKLWDRLEQARYTIARLEAQASQAQTDKAEAQRLLALEQVRARRRENDVAEGRLVEAAEVRTQIENLAGAVRTQMASMTSEIKLKLSLPDHACALVDKARRAFLERVARMMEQGKAEG